MRFLIRIVSLLLLGFHLKGQNIYENVVFQEINQVRLTRSEWKIACVFEIQTILDYVKSIANDIGRVLKVIANVQRDYAQSAKATTIFENEDLLLGMRDHSGFSQTFDQMLKEIAVLTSAYKGLQNELKNYAFLSASSRERRSLIPIVGRVLSGAFGLATTGQVRALRTGIQTLSDNQEKIYHLVENQISMINVSRKYIKENRQTINKLIIGVHQIDMKVNNISQILITDLNTIGRFVQIYSQLNLALQSIKRMIDSAQRYVDHLRLELSFLAIRHISPNLLSPEELSKILHQVRSKLPAAFRLPTHPSRKLWSYFRTLNCAAIIDNKKLIIIVTIPLLDNDESYQLYEIHNLAFPDPFTPSPNYESSMMALYRLETEALMVNTHRTEYIFITREELYSCSHSEGHYCNAQHARLPISKSRTCVISLFMKNSDKIKRYCVPEIYTNVHLPRAVNLKDGIYAVSTKNPFSLHLTCQAPPSSSEIQVKPPLTVVNLEMACSAHSQEITLMPYFAAQTTVPTQKEPFFVLLQETNFSEVKIWQPLVSSLKNFSSVNLPETLKNVDKISMTEFLDRLGSLQQVEIETKWHFPFWAKIAAGISGIICLVIVIKYRQQIALCLRRIVKRETLRVQEPNETIHNNVEATKSEDLGSQKTLQTQTRKLESIYPTLDLASMPGTGPEATTSST